MTRGGSPAAHENGRDSDFPAAGVVVDVGSATVELECNFLGTAAEGEVVAGRAMPAHLGRTTQVWDAVVLDEATSPTLALFRCTQVVLYPR